MKSSQYGTSILMWEYKKANLSLGGTIRNVTPQIFGTHPILRQYKTHKESFSFQIIYQKVFPSHVESKILIKFIFKNVLMWKMNA